MPDTAAARPDGAPGPMPVTVLGDKRVLELLGTVHMGRISFTQNAVPTIRPVPHLVHDGAIVFRTHGDARIAEWSAPGVVITFQADDIDPATGSGWSAAVTGFALYVSDRREVEHYARQLPLWGVSGPDAIVRITPSVTSGFLLSHGSIAD